MKHALGPGRQIIETYVSTGKVRYLFLQFPFLGEGSVRAAHASECAAEQGKFNEYREAVFRAVDSRGRDALSEDGLLGLVTETGLDMNPFAGCLVDQRILEVLRADVATVLDLGIKSTPTTIINGEIYSGAMPFSFYEDLIEKALSGD